MTVYEVEEHITEDFEKGKISINASGMYSTIEKARQAAMDRISEVYSEEEIKALNIPDDWSWLEVPSTEDIAGCTYIIYTYELDGRME